ncbi:MAG TPA: diadenylate cyclase CdaA [Tepidisphaeraceae bacterium]|nr:diadenylate cyclase CdaA [Tepidisphaeraceae bacterium]
MPLAILNPSAFFNAIRVYGWQKSLIELLLIAAVVYWAVKFLQGTRGARLFRGILFVLVFSYISVRLLSRSIDTSILTFLYEKLLLVATFATVVVFQPELRRALTRIGETRLFRGTRTQIGRDVDQLVEAAVFCSKRKIGMLVALEREVGLGAATENATRINAELSAPLLNSIFYPNSPLHDLGVVVSGGRIAYAGVQFPLAESGELERELGSRHRAAVGMSQETDAVVLVVSEETGDMSLAERGVLIRKLTPDALKEMLVELLGAGTYRPSSGEDQFGVDAATM